MKRLFTLTMLLVLSSHAFAWSHSGASRAGKLRSNTESHYGGHSRVK